MQGGLADGRLTCCSILQTIARLQSSLRGCAGLPDETRVRLAPLVPLGTKVGSLGMRSLEELPARLLQSSKVSQPSLPSPREAREERGEKEEVIDLTSPPGSPRASEAGSPIIIDDEQPPRTAEMARPPDKALLAGQQRPPQPLQEPSPPVPEALRRLLTSRKLPGTRGPQGKEQKGAERAGPRRDEQLWPSSWPSGVPVVKEASQVGRAPWSKAPLAGRGGAALGRPLTISVPSRPWSTENPPRAPRPLPDEKTPPAALVESSDDDLFNSAAPGQVFPSGCRGKPSAPQRRTTVAISAMGINSAPYAQRRARGGSSGPVMTVKEVQVSRLWVPSAVSAQC